MPTCEASKFIYRSDTNNRRPPKYSTRYQPSNLACIIKTYVCTLKFTFPCRIAQTFQNVNKMLDEHLKVIAVINDVIASEVAERSAPTVDVCDLPRLSTLTHLSTLTTSIFIVSKRPLE